MSRPWTKIERTRYRRELHTLYVRQNKTIGEIAKILHLSESGVYRRLQILDITPIPHKKIKYLNKRSDVVIPSRSVELAEFFGILLGDGHISHFQVAVTLGSKELSYVSYVQKLMQRLFCVPAKVSVKKNNYRDVYIGSTQITSWLKAEGLVSNKVAEQVGVPKWLLSKPEYSQAFVKGFFDTDGSVYKLKYGKQISFTNYSVPLLLTLQQVLKKLGYRVSQISRHRVYITKRDDVDRFFLEINPANQKHNRRYKKLCVGIEVVKRDAL